MKLSGFAYPFFVRFANRMELTKRASAYISDGRGEMSRIRWDGALSTQRMPSNPGPEFSGSTPTTLSHGA
jgi:hypothetical protein